MKKNRTTVIIGGGLAGLTAAIHLALKGANVHLIEKNAYPKHKVCGEYVSNEVLPYLEELGISPFSLAAKNITHFEFTGFSGQGLQTKLPLGGFGISRYALDQLLYDRAVEIGVSVLQDEVTDISFNGAYFDVSFKEHAACTFDYAVGAFGKRSGLDRMLSRKFIKHKSPWLAVKAHYKGDFPEHLVALHHFEGGYCGLSKVESDHINACYLADIKSFKKYKSIKTYQEEVLEKNTALKSFFSNAEMIFDKPLTISQISFEKKNTVEDHILMIGDSAGLIHPLCGNGMAMAIHSAKIASETLLVHLDERTSRNTLEQEYTAQWKRTFNKRMRNGAFIQRGLQNKTITKTAVLFLQRFPDVLRSVVTSTHGEPLL